MTNKLNAYIRNNNGSEANKKHIILILPMCCSNLKRYFLQWEEQERPKDRLPICMFEIIFKHTYQLIRLNQLNLNFSLPTLLLHFQTIPDSNEWNERIPCFCNPKIALLESLENHVAKWGYDVYSSFDYSQTTHSRCFAKPTTLLMRWNRHLWDMPFRMKLIYYKWSEWSFGKVKSTHYWNLKIQSWYIFICFFYIAFFLKKFRLGAFWRQKCLDGAVYHLGNPSGFARWYINL